MTRASILLALTLAASTAPAVAAIPRPMPEPRAVELGPLEDVVPVPVAAATEPPVQPRTRTTTASWYLDAARPADALYAAMPGVRFGSPVRWVAVTSFVDGTSRSVTVPVVDFCACYAGTPRARGIDLSPAAFRQLAPLGVGLVTVMVEEVE